MHAALDRRAVGSDPGELSGGELSRRPPGSQAGLRAQDARGGAAEPEYRRAVAQSPAMLSELQHGRRRVRKWCENEVIRAALTDLANVLREQGAVDESKCYIDATFASARDGGEECGATKRGNLENHGDRRSSRLIARGHHTCRQSPRGHVGPAEVRLLPERAAPIQSRSQDDAGRSMAAPPRTALDRRAALCLDSVATSAPGSLGISPGRFPRLRATRGSMYSAQAVLR